jgi:hypothetical protein
VQEIVAEWGKEMAREAADFTRSDALAAMALEPAEVEGADAEAMLGILKKAYRRQALRLHPDKNPDGPEPFLRMQRAYQSLLAVAQGEAESGGGPRPHRLTLLLRAQCLLHRREPDALGEFTYPAYDALLALLHSAISDGLEGEHVMLCLELMWLTLNACPGNAPFLGDKGAVPVLVDLLLSARASMSQDAPAHTRLAVIVTLTLRALALVLLSADARAEVAHLAADRRSEFLCALLWCCAMPRATNAAGAALAAVTAAAASAPLQQELVEKAVLADVFLRMLQCGSPLHAACFRAVHTLFMLTAPRGRRYNATDVVAEEIDIDELRGSGDGSAKAQTPKLSRQPPRWPRSAASHPPATFWTCRRSWCAPRPLCIRARARA